MKKFVSILLVVFFCITAFGGCKEKHVHDYQSADDSVIKCTEGGEKIMTCACGDSYTEVITPTEHTWGEWIETVVPQSNEEGERERVCQKCAERETEFVPRTDLNTLFNDYAEFLHMRADFKSVDDLSVNDMFRIIISFGKTWTFPLPGWATYTVDSESGAKWCYTEEDLNILCNNFFGRTFNWAQYKTVNNPSWIDFSKIAYDSKNKLICAQIDGIYGSFGTDETGYKFLKYEKISDELYKVHYNTYRYTYDWEKEDPKTGEWAKITHTYKRVITVEFKEGKFRIISHQSY